MTRPTFLTSKGERNAGKGVETDELIERYISIYTSRFKWSGLPEGCPPDFIERMMFLYGGVSAKKVRGLGVCVMGAVPSALSIYGIPARWMPVGILASTEGNAVNESIWKDSDTPVLYDMMPMLEKIRPYLELQRKAINALGCNLVGLTNPVLVECVPGSELNGKVIRNNLGAGDVFIPVIDRGAMNAEVLDLKATDHTANLTGVIHDTDNTIMDIMDVRSSMEKASGISVEEATASEQQIVSGMDQEFRKRYEWAMNTNAVLGTKFKVEPNDASDGSDRQTDSGTEETDSGTEE